MARSGWTWGLLLALTSITMPAPAQTAPEAGPATPAGTPTQQNAREKQLLERIRQLKAPRWRSYGVCRYDWTRWRLAEGGVRTTDVECGSSNSRNQIAVHCDTLQVARREGEGAWSPWRLPSSATESTTHGGEELMVAALCANLKPSETKPNAKPAAGSG
ncbi:MAG: hypothetical protein VKK98_08640 [Cyanobacteriota bacterium]|nr:hypothetical protein [Cyanobacteriota bacterium]